MIPVNGTFYSHTAFPRVHSSIEHLNQIQTYQSKFSHIQNAINSLPHSIEICNVLRIIQDFNDLLACCKATVGYQENIFTLEQLRHLEQQLTVNELVRLKEYSSDFEPIRQAINALPYSIEPHNVLDIVESFNNQLTDCKNTVGCYGSIFTLEQLRCLEQHLTVYKLKELKEYSSEIPSIQQAIDRIPSNIHANNASRIIELFNDEIADCKIGADYTEKAFSKEQVEELEQRLLDCDESLGQIWHVLPVNKPKCQKISTIKNG